MKPSELFEKWWIELEIPPDDSRPWNVNNEEMNTLYSMSKEISEMIKFHCEKAYIAGYQQHEAQHGQ